MAGIACGFTGPEAEAQMSSTNTSAQPAAGGSYQTPYALHFSCPQSDLAAGFDQAPWNDPQAEAAAPFATWEATHAEARGAAWGPPARPYPAPRLPRQDEAYLRERVIFVAALHIGLAYQHHHLPSWSPPAGWPWLPVAAGANGPGLDCSNFSSFVFNYALGLRLPSAIGAQAVQLSLAGPGGAGCQPVTRLHAARYEALIAVLQPADLLYFQDRHGRIRHTGFWVGGLAGTPLILDCTDSRHADGRGQAVPTGVHLRPFDEASWYWRHFSHAHRVIGAEARTCRVPGAFPEGDDRA
jgi:cell wall-associated NlpC family hydrolase